MYLEYRHLLDYLSALFDRTIPTNQTAQLYPIDLKYPTVLIDQSVLTIHTILIDL